MKTNNLIPRGYEVTPGYQVLRTKIAELLLHKLFNISVTEHRQHERMERRITLVNKFMA